MHIFSALEMKLQLILVYCGVQHVNQGTGSMIHFNYQNLTLVTGCIMKTLETTQLLAPHHLMASPNHCRTIGAQIREGLCYANSLCVCMLVNQVAIWPAIARCMVRKRTIVLVITIAT